MEPSPHRWCPTSSVTASPCHLPLIGEGIEVLKKLKIPPQKGAARQTQTAPSTYRKYSKATAHKSDSPVSGGAYQDARKVSLVWNARPKHWDLPEFRCSMHPIVTKHSFLPYLFSCERKDRAVGDIRQLQICSNLSVCFADSSPGRGAFDPLRRGTIPQALRASSLYTREPWAFYRPGRNIL